jgi:HK97 gp10 family phage protein
LILEVKITGLDDILQNLMRLNLNETIENKALTEAGKVTKTAIESESKFGNRSRGIYKNNIKLRRPKDGEVIIHSSKAYHGHLIEFGRSGGSIITKKGKKITWGPTAPNPVFARGFESSKNEAKEAMIAEIQKGLGL